MVKKRSSLRFRLFLSLVGLALMVGYLASGALAKPLPGGSGDKSGDKPGQKAKTKGVTT